MKTCFERLESCSHTTVSTNVERIRVIVTLTPGSIAVKVLEKLTILIALTVCLSASSALADDKLRRLAEEWFDLLDPNDDDLVSRDEFVSTFIKLEDQKALMHERRLEKLDSDLRQRFGRMDSDEDGQLSQSEFVSVMASEDRSDETQQQGVFSRLDQDQDGLMSYEEFGNAMKRRLSTSRSEERSLEEGLRQRFVRMDSDESGSVSQTEYVKANTTKESSTQDQQEGVFLRLDQDQDGLMSYEEFGSAMKRRLSARTAASGNNRVASNSQETAARLEEGFAQRFDELDTDRDSVITIEELLNSAQQPREVQTREGAQSDFDRMDLDSNDSISQDEYISAMKRRLSRRVASLDQIESEIERQEAIDRLQQGLSQRFERMDSNDDGQVTRSEMKAAQRPTVDR